MRTRRVVIADDEPLARERLRLLLASDTGYELIGEAADGDAALELIVRDRPEIVFLDVQMPGLDGLEVVELLATAENDSNYAPVIIFVTAFDEYAVRAFDASATDYLRKPFDADRFHRALRRAEERLAARQTGHNTVEPELKAFLETLRREREYPERFIVRGPKGAYFVRIADIQWVDAQANYVRLHASGRAHFVRDTMKAFEQRLDPRDFVRVNRSVIVNIDHIERFESHGHGEYELLLRDGVRVTSSRQFGAQLHALLRE